MHHSSENILVNLNKGFDSRIVNYEDIHNISESDFDKMFHVVSPVKGDLILDLGCGYGSVTREIILREPSEHLNFHLSDSSHIQLNRAICNINRKVDVPQKSTVKFFLDDIVQSKFKSNCFDIIVAKMMLHEVNKEDQKKACREIFRILKPGGRLIVWDLALDDSNQSLVQQIIKKKDELANFSDLVTNRYLFTISEIQDNLLNSGFTGIAERFKITYRLETFKRLSAEFTNDFNKLLAWNDFILASLASNPDKGAASSLFKRFQEDNVILEIPKAIFSAIKPN